MFPADFKLPLHIAARNRARDYYNPLRGLDMPRLIRLLDAGERGEHADLQWLYRTIEKRDSTLRGLKMRRTSAIKKLDWDIKVPDTLPSGATPAMADAQAKWLRSLYEGIENLTDAFEFLTLASFRGFAHLEKRFRDDNPALPLARLEPVPQWHWCRHPETWAWMYDAGAASNWSGGVAIDPDDFVIRELDDPINEVAAICFLRKNTSQKDWDAFVEDFGIPSIFAMLAESTPPDRVKEWLEIVERVTGNSRGALPPGAKVETIAHGSQGETPFKQHKDEQREELVLAGTGGLLAMLTAPTGMNSGQADAHGKAFDEIAVAEGASISALLQAQIDQPALRREFPGQPVCAYFQLAAVDTEDRAALGSLVVQLKQAGLEPDAGEISEKTGLKLTKAPPPAAPAPASAAAFQPAPFRNRAAVAAGNEERFMAASAQRLADAGRAALAPLHERMAALAELDDEAAFAGALEKLRADLPALEKQCLGDDATAELEEAFSEIVGAALADGIASRATPQTALKNNNPNRDDGGMFASDGGDQTGGKSQPAAKPAPAPKRITVAQADARLAKGEKVTSADGKAVNFGVRLKQKLESAPEYAGRKELLDFGQEAVRSGKRITETTGGDKRDIYYRQFDLDGKTRGLITIVSVRDGEAFNIRHVTQSQAKRKGLLNREGHFGYEPDGQPSVTVIRAIVAADRASDCPSDSALSAKSQATKTRGRKESKTRPLPSRAALPINPAN